MVIETPTYYHAEQASFAVDAGKHVYMAKPVAVDVPGCKSVLASGKKAQEKKLTYWVDFQTRSRDVYKELATRVHRGDIGKPVLAQVFYYAGRPSKDRGTPGMDAGQRRMSNFYMDKVLGGDIIVEQNIHVIDVANWLLQGHPMKAYGSGGRTDWSGTPFDAGRCVGPLPGAVPLREQRACRFQFQPAHQFVQRPVRARVRHRWLRRFALRRIDRASPGRTPGWARRRTTRSRAARWRT